MKGEIFSARWGVVGKEKFISCFKTSFQPLLDPVVSHPFVYIARSCLLLVAGLACHPSKQAKGFLLHEAFSSRPAYFQSNYIVRWDVGQRRCFGNPGGQFESDFWTTGPLQSLSPKDITLTRFVPQSILLLISLLTFFSKQHMTLFSTSVTSVVALTMLNNGLVGHGIKQSVVSFKS